MPTSNTMVDRWNSAPSAAEMADLLDQQPDYRVLRMFRPRDTYGDLGDDYRTGVFVDVEATGLDTNVDKVIQFAAVRFLYDAGGNVGKIVATYDSLEDPGFPLDPEVAYVTGLSDEKLKGQKIDDSLVRGILDGAHLCIAHNADFDRKMVERRFPRAGFHTVPWACSQRDVDWRVFDCQYIGLEYLLMKSCGEFFLPHDALDDCRVGLHILAAPKRDGRSPMSHVLDSVNSPVYRLFAWNSAFSTKDRLRNRKFRWNPDLRVWAKDMKETEVHREIEWLAAKVYGSFEDADDNAEARRLSPLDRFSTRA